MTKYLFLCLLLVSCGLTAQDFSNYEPLRCGGTIPEEILTSSGKKYTTEIKKIDKKKTKRSEQKDRKQFALESNFVTDNLMQSGLVLFNDQVSNYLNEVAGQLIADDGGFKQKVRVYTLRSTEVNAFATDRGTVFVTLGLLARIENEAQLAFILSHELTHVREGHTLDLFLGTKDIARKSSERSVLNNATFDNSILSKNLYSRELEKTADRQGLDRFLKTNYSTTTLDRVFDMLKYAYLPYSQDTMAHYIIESDGYKLPQAYWLNQFNPIKGEEDDAESKEKSTHPSTGERRDYIAEALSATTAKSGAKEYLISEEKFKMVREIARFELPNLYLHNQDMPNAVYTSFLLLQKYPLNGYAQKTLANTLYLCAKLKNDADYTITKTSQEAEGPSHQAHFLLETMTGQEMTVLALRYAWNAHLQHPQDKEIGIFVDDLFIEINDMVPSIDSFAVPIATTDSSYWKTAFTVQLKDESFRKGYADGAKSSEKRKKRIAYNLSEEGQHKWEKQQKKEAKNGKQLGIPKVVIVNPFYLKIDARRENAIQYVQAENAQQHLRELIQDIAPKSGLKVNILDVNDLKPAQTDKFNDIRLLNDYFSEQVQYDELSLTPGLNQTQINAIADKYGTDYFLWTGVISLREKKGTEMVLACCLGVLVPYALPYVIYKVAKPEYDMLYFAVLYDVRSNRHQTVKFEYFDQRDSDAVLKAHCYDTFWQIKSKPKKK